WQHASAAKIADAVIHGLIDRVRIDTPPTEDMTRYRQGATVTIRTHDGRSQTSTVLAPKGAAVLGLAWQDIDAKDRNLVPMEDIPGKEMTASRALLHDFRRADGVAGLIHALCSVPG